MRWIITSLLAALAALITTGQPVSRQPALLDTATVYMTTTALLRSRVIPDSVFTMTHLRFLSITGMDCDYREVDEHGNDIMQCWTIDVIPPEIGRLKDLEELVLPLNAIRVIPPELGSLRRLRVLDLSDNFPLADIEPIALLDSLEELSLCGCGEIRALPKDLTRLKRLKRLCLVGTHLDRIERRRVRRALPRCRIVF